MKHVRKNNGGVLVRNFFRNVYLSLRVPLFFEVLEKINFD